MIHIIPLLLQSILINAHGLPSEDEHFGNGIKFSLFPWTPDVQTDAVEYFENFTFDSNFSVEMSRININLPSTMKPNYMKFFEAQIPDLGGHLPETTGLLRFGSTGSPSNMLFRLEYHQAEHNHTHKPTVAQAIVGGIIGVTVTNLCSLLGGVCIHVQKLGCYRLLLTFMIGLAVAALSSTAMLVLLPEALSLHMHGHDAEILDPMSIKLIIVLVGAFFFYLLEYVFIRLPVICRARPSSKEDISNSEVLREDISAEYLIEEMDVLQTESVAVSLRSRCCGKISVNCSGEAFAKIAPVAWMILFGDAVHNLMDGLTIGAGFSRSISVGITLSISILLEELPHELGDFAILISSGFSVKAALFCNFMSACVAYIGLIIGLAIGEVPTSAAIIFAITTGFFLYISLSDMLPELRETIKEALVANQSTGKVLFAQCLGLLVGFGSILAVILVADKIEIH